MVLQDQSSNSISTEASTTASKKVNWLQVGTFLGLTFGLTWLLDLFIYLKGGLTNPAVGTALQFQMLLPAFSAILLGMFFFKDSPINIKHNRTRSRWFTWYYLVFTLIYAAAVVISFVKPELMKFIGPIMMLPSLVGMILVIVLRLTCGKDTFASVGMGGGKAKLWFIFGLGLLAFQALQAGLNYVFKLGHAVDLSPMLAQTAATGMSPQIFMIILAVQTIVLGPFLGLLVTFGEEYGWRGYLQSALIRLGRVRGIALGGVIWGIWHWPVIWMGYNYPNQPILGSLMMVLFCLELAFFLGYAVLKAKGIWIAAFLHALVNQSMSFFLGFIYAPNNLVMSFGMGIPGLVMMAIVIALLLRDPIWKETD